MPVPSADTASATEATSRDAVRNFMTSSISIAWVVRPAGSVSKTLFEINFTDLIIISQAMLTTLRKVSTLDADASGVLLREGDERIGVTTRVSKCFVDYRYPTSAEHGVDESVGQRLYGFALGYEDLNDPVYSTLLSGELRSTRPAQLDHLFDDIGKRFPNAPRAIPRLGRGSRRPARGTSRTLNGRTG